MTGVAAATLRQWQRRYGVPDPKRTEAGYRIYSAHEIDQIRRIVALGARGISPSQAAKQVLAEDAAADEGRGFARRMPTGGDSVLDALDPYLEARRRIIDTVERYDFDGLTDVTRKLLYLGSAVAIFEHIIAPAMREIGQRWHAGTLTVAQEHMASEAIGQLVHQLLPLVQPTDTDRVALLACMGEDTHSLPLYGVGFRLAQWGYRSMVLGARTPPEAIAATRLHTEPMLIGLSVTVAPGEMTARRLAQAYAEAAGPVPWVVGGRGARSMAESIEAAGGIVAPTDATGLRGLMQQLAADHRSQRSG